MTDSRGPTNLRPAIEALDRLSVEQPRSHRIDPDLRRLVPVSQPGLAVSLQLFLAMSLMSMDLSFLAGAFGQIFIVLNVQTIVLTLFAVFVFFRVMGRDYNAAVIVGGFCGLGMGATPVAMANMSSVTSKYRPPFKAFLVVPLVGAFFIDLLNALVIKFVDGLPLLQDAPIPGA